MMPAAPNPWNTRATASVGSEYDSAQAERGQREDHQPPLVDPAVAEDVAQRGQRQQRYRDRELIGVHHPDRIGRAGVQVAGDGGQRHVGDRAVQHGHRQAERDREDRPVALRHRHAVGWRGRGRGGGRPSAGAPVWRGRRRRAAADPLQRGGAQGASGKRAACSTRIDLQLARSGRRITRTEGPRGAHSAGSESRENSTMDGQAAAIRCIVPVSLPTARRAARARLARSAKSVRSVRSTAAGTPARMACARSLSSRCRS